tara:strand:- start:3673 stop:4605 length:933 start_codon:yes stop_codon:yes gene_type:complete
MIKYHIRIFIFILFSLFYFEKSFAEINNSIIISVGNQPITKLDLLKEIKMVAILSNTNISNENKEQIKKLAVQSLINRTIKNQEIVKYGIENYDKKDLDQMISDTEKKLGLSRKELKNLFELQNLNYNSLITKFETDLKWNSLIFRLYKNKITLNTVELESQIRSEVENTKQNRIFYISEIVINLPEDGGNNAIKEVLESINNNGFENAAKKLSISSSAENGGKIGWFQETQLSKKIFSNIENIKVNEVGKPLIIDNTIVFIKKNDEKTNDLDVEKIKQNLVSKEKEKKLRTFSKSHFSNLERTVQIKFL